MSFAIGIRVTISKREYKRVRYAFNCPAVILIYPL